MVLWHQAESTKPRPLILIAHGGGQSSRTPSVGARAEMLADRGYDAVALNDELTRRAVPECRQLLDELENASMLGTGTRVGFWGLSLGAAIGFALLSIANRVQAGVLGLAGDNLAEVARTVVTPIQFIMQWDDEIIAKENALKLFASIGSEDKTLHANSGKHGEVPLHEHVSALEFFDRQLMSDVGCEARLACEPLDRSQANPHRPRRVSALPF